MNFAHCFVNHGLRPCFQERYKDYSDCLSPRDSRILTFPPAWKVNVITLCWLLLSGTKHPVFLIGVYHFNRKQSKLLNSNLICGINIIILVNVKRSSKPEFRAVFR